MGPIALKICQLEVMLSDGLRFPMVSEAKNIEPVRKILFENYEIYKDDFFFSKSRCKETIRGSQISQIIENLVNQKYAKGDFIK